MENLFNISIEPPFGWAVTWDIKGQPVEIIESNYWYLVDAVRNKLRWNDEPIPEDLELQIQRDICSRLPNGWCSGVEGDKEWFTLKDLTDSSKTIFSLATVPADERTVPQAEAERRATICSTCPKNRRVAGCWPCVIALPIFDGLLPGVTTSLDKKIFGCSVCKCALHKKVHVRKEHLAPRDEYPSHCWMKEVTP